MTVPNFLASSFYFGTGSSPITDVATIITDVRTILTSTNNPPWTEPVTGTFQSPVDSANRFMRIILSRNTATRLNVTLQDQNFITLYAREFDIQATATVYYYTGQYHFIIESYNGTATADMASGFILDVSPYQLNASQNYVLGRCYRATSGSPDGNGGTTDQFYMLENGVTAARQRARAYGQTASLSIGLIDSWGNPQIFPMDMYCIMSNSVNCWGGKLYQSYLVPFTAGASAVKRIALDDGTIASFRCLQAATVNNCLMAVRVA